MLDTWVARGFFMIMVLAFVTWGVGDVVRMIGTSTWVAKVDGQTIEGPQLQEAYQRDMAQAHTQAARRPGAHAGSSAAPWPTRRCSN